jgi:hypothetical protein
MILGTFYFADFRNFLFCVDTKAADPRLRVGRSEKMRLVVAI